MRCRGEGSYYRMTSSESGAPSGPPTDQDAIRFLTEIVGIPSISGQEQAVAAHIASAMVRMGLEAEIDGAGSPVGRLGSGDRHVLLLGHIDTVSGEIRVRREGDLLYGRGSVDAKGPFAAFVCAAARVGSRPGLRITVVGAVEEECATSKGAYHVAETMERPDYVVIGEPSGWQRVTLGYKGRLLVDYRLERSMSHTAGEEKGACEEAVDYWLQIRDWAQAHNQGHTSRFTTLDPSLRQVSSTSDGLSEHVEMQIGLRLPVDLDVGDLLQRVQSWSGEARVTTRGYEVPYRAEKRNALTSAFLASIRGEGARAAFVTKTGTSDMNVLGPKWDRPIVAYGPGDSSLDHTPNEHIALDEYLSSIRVLEQVLWRLASGRP